MSGDDADLPTAHGYRLAIGAICLCLATVVIVSPVAAVRLPEIPGMIPFLGAVALTTDLSTSFLLLVTFRDLRRPSLLVLALAYLFAGVMAALNLAAFPGVLARDAILWGSTQSYPWSFQIFWLGYGALGLAAMMIECAVPGKLVDPAAARRAIVIGLAVTVMVASGLCLVTFRFVDLLPALVQASPPVTACAMPLVDGNCPTELVGTPLARWTRYASFASMALTVALGAGIAGRRSQTFLWFTVAIACTLSVNIMSQLGGTRFSLGWTLSRVGWLVSASIVFLVFMGRFAGQLRLLSRAKDILEQRVHERTAALAVSLRERDLLLKEVYHRVKNNMQVVDSMLFIERRRAAEPATRGMIDLLRQRFGALGLVHRQLMASEDLEHFDLAPFLKELVRNIGASEGVSQRGIELTVCCDSATINLDFAIPLSLVVTELVTKSLKHADPRLVSVLFKCSDGIATLTVNDDGRGGMQGGSGGPAGAQTPGHGSMIIAGLVAQLDGRMAVTSNGGLRTDVVMPIPAGGTGAGR